jgi:hypothetical protein
MDTAGQIVGKRSQAVSGNTKTEIQNERTEEKSRSSKHKIRTTKWVKVKENRDQGSKAKCHTNKQKKEKLEDFSKIVNSENNPGYSNKKEVRQFQKESHTKERKPTSKQEQMTNAASTDIKVHLEKIGNTGMLAKRR